LPKIVFGTYVTPDGPNDDKDDIEQNTQWMVVIPATIQNDKDHDDSPERPWILSPLVG
jgi:hypothetical protein